MGESEWAGLTASGGLAKDMTKEYVAIDLISPSGIKWSTIREADKAGSFKVGKYVDVIEQAPIEIAGKTGKDMQAMSAADFRQFVSDNALEIRNLGDEDLPYLTKYLDESRINIVDDIRSAEVTPVIETTSAIKSEIREATDLEANLRDSFKNMDDQEFRKAVANNMDDIETANLDNLELTPKQRALIEAEIGDRQFIRDITSEFNAIDVRLSEAREGYELKAISADEYADIIKESIAQKRNILDDAKDIQKTFDNRFKDVEPITCAASSNSGAAMGAETAASAASALQLTDLAKIAAPAAVATAVTLGANSLFGPRTPSSKVTKVTNDSIEQPMLQNENATQPFSLTNLSQVDPEAYYLTKSGNTIQGKQIATGDLPYIVKQLSADEINV